jgi:hypothetical protein
LRTSDTKISLISGFVWPKAQENALTLYQGRRFSDYDIIRKNDKLLLVVEAKNNSADAAISAGGTESTKRIDFPESIQTDQFSILPCVARAMNV